MDLLAHSHRSLRGGSDRLILSLLLLAAGKNGNGRKSKNGDGLHIYLTWYMVICSPARDEQEERADSTHFFFNGKPKMQELLIFCNVCEGV